MGAAAAWLSQAIQSQRGMLSCWVPVCLGIGIGGYFALRVEPSAAMLAALGLAGLAAAALARRAGGAWSPLLMAAALAAMGLGLAGARAHSVAGVVLAYRYYGPVEGRIVALDRSAADAPRMTLDRVTLDAPRPYPQRVRVSLHGPGPHTALTPGKRVMVTASLSPTQGAVEPGGFDFRRHAWFLRLGAVGYARTPVMAVAAPEGVTLARIRARLTARIRAALPDETGAMAAALITGDRSAVARTTLDALRASNLAHLLAISGLHMGLVTGAVFAALRLALVLVPRVGARWPVKRLAAAGALIAATGYLALSGAGVATERAYVMASVVLGAVMVNRRAISLRSVAVAATLILAFQPEALLSPGFQMSFAATVALVVAYGIRGGPRLPRPLRAFGALVLSSFVAGSATAPIAMAHFNMLSHYGLLANTLSLPVMGLVVMPAAVLALLLMPLGAEAAPLWLMGQGIDWILAVAERVSALPAAVSPVLQPGPAVLPMLVLGALWLVLWRGHGRWLGVPLCALAVWLWTGTQRPALLIAEDGGLAGILTPQGRALSHAKGDSFVAEVWLENDGDTAVQQDAAARWPVPDWPVRVLRGKRALEAFEGCDTGEIIVANGPLPGDWPCDVWDAPRLARSGAVAGHLWDGVLHMVTVRDRSGARLWSAPPVQTGQ
ncbi:MAG: ComEC/Rec2 family competence protein [Roseivivax sp.]|nr:ComEC/Rec2 family competence protein [Roseivivax sp.]